MSATDQIILIIDDSVINIVLLEAVLKARGYNIKTALSATEAYKIIALEKPGLILLDLLMPEISGFTFLEQIKSREETRQIPVIVVSALNDSATISKTKKMGATGYIKKPVELKILLNQVKEIIG